MSKLCRLAAIVAAVPLLAQHGDNKDQKSKNPAIGDPQAIVAGSKLFRVSCSGCHGPRGEGGRGPNLVQRNVWHPLEEEDLFLTIQKGVPGADMPGTNLPEDQLWQLVAFVRSLTAPAAESRPAGDSEAGEKVFFVKGECASCHRILGRGGMLGPDLSNIGAMRPVEKIRLAVLDPDADGFAGYRGVVATLQDGQVIRGVLRNRTNYSVQIQDKQGTLHLLSTNDLRELQLSNHSPMPRDYKQRLSSEELVNLIAYLSKQTVRPITAVDKKK